MYIFRGKLFKFRLFFVILQLHLPVTATMSFENDGADGWSTTLRKSDTVRFVFDYLNYHNQISFKDKCRGDAYGCVYHTQPECAEGLLCPHAHFWVIVYTPEGIKSVRSIERAIPTA